MVYRCLIAVLLLTAIGQCGQKPAFSTFNCISAQTDPPICERVKYPKFKSWFVYYEVEAAIAEAHSGLKPRVVNPWLELGQLRDEEAPACQGDLKKCAVIVYQRNQEEKITKTSVRMRHWDLRIFALAWGQVFEDSYRDKLTEEQFKQAVARAIITAEHKISADALREE
ncbi:MAG TPA: hypothetical protein VLA89_03265 [Gemmatimonadales bacterium]|nr:hypothetical protein [Gemmatimonadales bacterium]